MGTPLPETLKGFATASKSAMTHCLPWESTSAHKLSGAPPEKASAVTNPAINSSGLYLDFTGSFLCLEYDKSRGMHRGFLIDSALTPHSTPRPDHAPPAVILELFSSLPPGQLLPWCDLTQVCSYPSKVGMRRAGGGARGGGNNPRHRRVNQHQDLAASQVLFTVKNH